MLITTLAGEFADEIKRLSGDRIPIIACADAEDALRQYTDQTVLFGSPGMIARIIDQMPTVNWVQSSWAGVTPLTESTRRDYVLTGVKEVFGAQMAEYALGYLLAHELKVVARREAQARHEWLPEHSGTLAGKRLGIMGTGSIGAAIAKAASAFDLQVTGLSRSGAAHEDFAKVFDTGQLRDFLTPLDYLVSVLPDTASTTHLIDSASLAYLPKGACFVNVGRSNVIDDEVLLDSLTSGQLGGATLDVFDEEPLPATSPLWDAPNLTITAHVAAISYPQLLVPIFVSNYERYVHGKPLRFPIDLSLGY